MKNWFRILTFIALYVAIFTYGFARVDSYSEGATNLELSIATVFLAAMTLGITLFLYWLIFHVAKLSNSDAESIPLSEITKRLEALESAEHDRSEENE